MHIPLAWLLLILGCVFGCPGARAEGPLNCVGARGELFPTLPGDRFLEPFPPMIKSTEYRTSCTLCADGRAQGYFYNLSDDIKMVITGEATLYFQGVEAKFIGTNTEFIDRVVGAGEAGILAERIAPLEAQSCKFYVDEEAIRYQPLAP